MFKMDTSDLKDLEDDLKTFAKRAYPFATKNTLNTAAFNTRSIAQEDIRGNMTLRNRFTLQSIQVDQARTLIVSQQQSIIGSTADYMEDQEFGGTKSKPVIATSYSAGQGLRSEPRTRLPRRANKMESIRLSNRRRRSSSKRQQNLIKIRQAAKSGSKYVFLDLKRSRGIFKVIGGARRPKLRMVHDMSSQSVVIPRNPWLAPAVAQVEQRLPTIYKKSLEFQARRQGLFR